MRDEDIEQLSSNLTENFIKTRRLKLNTSTTKLDDDTASTISTLSEDTYVRNSSNNSTMALDITQPDQMPTLSNEQVSLKFSAIMAEMNRRGLSFPFVQNLALQNAKLDGLSPTTITTTANL